VDAVLSNPSSSGAIEHSVEFCGGTLVMLVICDIIHLKTFVFFIIITYLVCVLHST